MKYLIDTNILIYFFNGQLPDHVKKSILSCLEASFTVSVITKMEFLGFKAFTQAQFLTAQEFLSGAMIVPLSADITDLTIQLRRIHSIKLPEAIIAATALNGKRILVTRNSEDFARIPGLTILNPWEE